MKLSWTLRLRSHSHPHPHPHPHPHLLPPSNKPLHIHNHIHTRSLFTKPTPKPHHDPLRILFCGSEDFSIASLRALHQEHLHSPSTIASIDVVCRPPKRVGRGLKQKREVPIEAEARSLSLPIHEIDTFRDWTPPPTRDDHPINLVIAVSFGLFVPPRILYAAKYGGLNVHPSMLPDFRGPAPLHNALLAGAKKTGVTLQTLHPERFDQGTILAQTPWPGFDIPNPHTCTVKQLLDYVSPKGAELLIHGLRERLFLPPVRDMGWYTQSSSQSQNPSDGVTIRTAPKITKEDSHIDWTLWSAKEILRRNLVLGPLWSFAPLRENLPSHTAASLKRRIIFEDISVVEREDEGLGLGNLDVPVGVPYVFVDTRDGGSQAVLVNTVDRRLVVVERIKVEGERATGARGASLKARLFKQPREGDRDGGECLTFYDQLV
ncbi:MAG: Methionyl-tRNA formyltransferase [Cirrosporium novae-zelandiae]|nr:MAG: Methionyl-tRNA formyltransferase [Cirrosporium novae-zelandiae]